jgi:hypothetical protein
MRPWRAGGAPRQALAAGRCTFPGIPATADRPFLSTAIGPLLLTGCGEHPECPLLQYYPRLKVESCARRLINKSCLSSPVLARWPALGERAYTCMCVMCGVCVCCQCFVLLIPTPEEYRALDLRRGYFSPNQVNDSNKGSNGPAGSRSGKLHSEERDGLSVTGRSPASPESNEGPPD